jgi:transposase InsO family protein
MVTIRSIYNINCQCTIFTQFSKQPGEPLLEAPVYRLLKAHDLIASPAFIVIKAADAFKDKTTAPNQLWQTDFTYLKVIGWGWFYLSTVLDDFSRYIVAWKLCTTMTAEGVTARAGAASLGVGPGQPRRSTSPPIGQRIQLCRRRPGQMARGPQHQAPPWRALSSDDAGQDRALASYQTLKNRILLENYFLPGDLEARIAAFVADYNHRRYHESIDNLTRPTSTSHAAQPSRQNDKGSNSKPWPIACSINCEPPDITRSMSQSLLYFTSLIVSITLMTDSTALKGFW